MRTAHWIKPNHQERIPPRMVALDTESKSLTIGDFETQEWRNGAAIRWRTDLKSGDMAEASVFRSPETMWTWISEYTRKESRTVVWAHNLSHDVRISKALTILPSLGYTLEWCNLDQSVSAMVWRSDHGTIVMADTWTWLPVPLSQMGECTGLDKFPMPPGNSEESKWDVYCLRDAQIVYRAASQLVNYIRANHLGNWQPTGAGMAYSTWRHKYMQHKILVHDDKDALEAERKAMHTGRAEAWKHGKFQGHPWTEVDLRNAYITIAAECELPRKLRYHTGSVSYAQFQRLRVRNAVLCRCDIRTDSPSVPVKTENGFLWPVGQFETWLWDTEVDCAVRYGANVHIREAYVYDKAPILQAWATWILSVLRDRESEIPPVVRTWLKHCSRALIGRLSLRTRSWEYFGTNPDGYTGITHIKDLTTGITKRLMHVGEQTLVETDPEESKDSVPMITGWIMSECRVRLWDAMNAAGLENIAHVDTDSVLVSREGLARLQAAYQDRWDAMWSVKGSWRTIDLVGPRHYYRGHERVMAGIPAKAEELARGTFRGERWASLATDLEARGDGVVTTYRETWTHKNRDPRRRDAPGVTGDTEAYSVGFSSSSKNADAPSATLGA